MSEVQFAKSFLSILDRKPSKLSSDYVSDPKKYPAQSPYTLPKPTHPFPKRQKTTTSESTKTSITITLKPTKGPSEPLTLPSLESQTTVLDLKTQYAEKTSTEISKIKLLYNKRPASDLKSLKELLPDPLPANAELNVMILGGGGVNSPAVATPEVASPAVEVPDPTSAIPAPARSEGKEALAPLSERKEMLEGTARTEEKEGASAVLASEEFWADLKGFLVQRLRDEGEGERLLGVFREASKK